MKKLIITLGLLSTVAFCDINVNDDMSKFSHPDQFDKIHTVTNDTKGLIFAFKKESGHGVKEFLATKDENYLTKMNIMYVADVSAMPTIIQWFALPSLKDYAFPIVVFNNDELSKKYKNEQKIEKIMLVILKDKIVQDVKYFDNTKQLEVELNK